jgi:formate-dependent nitrite reductase membrane component NrfD
MTGKGFTISIPILMLGPYLRPFLYWISGISVAVCILLLIIAVFSQGIRSKDKLVLSAIYWFVFAVTTGALTLVLHIMGMP